MNITYPLLISLLFISLLHSHSPMHYDNIIIGAGIAGIGASMVLSNHSVPHLLLQVRNRIGGRIAPFEFADTIQELGASFIQLPKQNNMVDPYVTAFNIPQIPAKFDFQTYWYVNKSICSDSDINSALPVFDSLMQYISLQASKAKKDEPVLKFIKSFWKSHPQYYGFTKDLVMLYMESILFQNGGQLYNFSALLFTGSNNYSQLHYDYSPLNGYSALLKRLYSTYCKPKLQLSQKVLKVDYSGTNIIVKTNKAKYSTNKLFISVPLGVLKDKQILFNPPLPKDKVQAINSIGFANYQKLYVTFSAPFWPSSGSTLQFIGKNKPSRYLQAQVVPPQFAKGKHMLIFWIKGDLARQITKWTLQQIKCDLISHLGKFIPSPVTITNLYMTDWTHDPHALGSFTFSNVGIKTEYFQNMKRVIRTPHNRIWFIGEHVDPQQYSFSHGAFKSGIQAAQESLLP